jgi:hypothetical protein
MINYLNILNIWDIVENSYVRKFDATTKVMTNESKLAKRDNDNAVNSILNSVSESVTVLFSNMTTANEMWNVLFTQHEKIPKLKEPKLMHIQK